MERGLGVQLERRIGPRDQALGCRLLIPGGPINLPCEIQTLDQLCLERRMQLRRRTIIILHRIPGPQNVGRLQSRYRPDKGQLHLKGQTGRDSVHVIFPGLTPLRLEKNLMPLLVGKAHHFVLDRRTIPRPNPLDDSRIHWRLIEISPDQVMGVRVGVS